MNALPTSPSSSGRSQEFLPFGFGVDTLALALPCSPATSVPAGAHTIRQSIDPLTGEISETARITRLDLGVPFVELRQTHVGSHVRVECSLPRLLWGCNNVPAPPHRIKDLLAEVSHGLAALGVEAHVPLARITRLDLVRDFQDVPEPAAVLDALSRVPPHRSDITMKSYSGKSGGTARVTCVVRETRDYLLRFYDKAEQTRRSSSPAALGLMRCELQLRRSALDGLRDPHRLPAQDLWRTLHDHFQRMRFDRPLRLHQGPGALPSASTWQSLPARDRKAFPAAIGLSLLEHAGLEPIQDPKTRRKHRDLLTCIPVEADSPAGRLDLPTGRFLTLSPHIELTA